MRALVRQGQSEDAQTSSRRKRVLLVRGRAWAQAAARRHGWADTGHGPRSGDQGGLQPCGRGGGAAGAWPARSGQSWLGEACAITVLLPHLRGRTSSRADSRH